MSRGFVKDGDQEEVPLVPPRADLPAGETNYVTQAGYDALLAEKEGLLEEARRLDAINENDHRIALNHINAKLQLLADRIATAKIIDLKEQPTDEVRFGATVTLQVGNGKSQKFQIVGVDEADITRGKIAFVAPLARLLMEKKAGEEAVLKLKNGNRVFKIVAIDYA
ncbi:MAG TPA: GreA/GreB family elongation factor [Cyclobacteriaceae bacterium]|nr:GreA/GreB family elongation factor [Cyclobacteriaceae bacterium]MCB9239108.1 GreA/GreB family elongation factor [Flammeovirgaceae bacterium]MCB0499816.1 GreA/GreB family elongation factor [Cyclobacteriaceae bacterium]MCO5271296.1 GreA/GreB family elongation factor [Cyclobacteriaceae bacterium]MCW5902871.1 GreA/GreB family elongation factor [Cyclobacteriaceae bacterium]